MIWGYCLRPSVRIIPDACTCGIHDASMLAEWRGTTWFSYRTAFHIRRFAMKDPTNTMQSICLMISYALYVFSLCEGRFALIRFRFRMAGIRRSVWFPCRIIRHGIRAAIFSINGASLDTIFSVKNKLIIRVKICWLMFLSLLLCSSLKHLPTATELSENFVLLGYYAASCDNFFTTYRSHLQASRARGEKKAGTVT
jgi:hypothetical protein